ncbi:MAG: hypothetical protein V3T53_02275 [Phycisphaerales bacterium]
MPAVVPVLFIEAPADSVSIPTARRLSRFGLGVQLRQEVVDFPEASYVAFSSPASVGVYDGI